MNFFDIELFLYLARKKEKFSSNIFETDGWTEDVTRARNGIQPSGGKAGQIRMYNKTEEYV